MDQNKANGLAVEVDEVSFNYGKTRVLDTLSLQIPAGISFGLLGPNGAGKTTLIRVLVGLLKPRSGSVRIQGRTPSRSTARSIGPFTSVHRGGIHAEYGQLDLE